MKFPAYVRYKPSGIEWLGDVPGHWEVKRLGYLVSKIGSGKTPRGGADVYQSDGVMLIRSQNVYDTGLRLEDVVFVDDLVDEEMAGTRVRPHDVLLNITGASLGRCAIAPSLLPPANVNQHVCIIRPVPSLANANFIHLAMTSLVVQSQILGYENGSSREGLNFQQVRKLVLTLPPLAEQQAIAAFLDRETERLDRLVAKKQELIERLKEKRTALISRTVTQGLPAEAAKKAGLSEKPSFKPSGIEWIGDIPKHWNLIVYKRVCTRVDVGIAEAATHAYCDDGIPIIRSTNVKANKLDTSDVLRIEPWFAAKNRPKTLRAGDLVTVRTGYPGTTAAIPPELDGCQCFTLVLSTPKKTEHGPFFSWFMNSNPGANYFEMEGWGTAQTNISVPIVRFMPVPHPPLPEQAAIAAYLDEETAKLDALVAKVEEAVERLQEYRTALITATVTGKMDVRVVLK